MHSDKIIDWCKFLLCVSLFQLNFFEADLKVVIGEISILNTTSTVLVYSYTRQNYVQHFSTYFYFL